MTVVPARDRVELNSLSLRDLRNYADLSLPFDALLIAFSGSNGVGKTNLLEAISLLTPGRGLRRANYAEITRRGTSTGWAVAASVTRNGSETRLGTGLVGMPSGDAGRKVRINGADAPVETMLDYLRMLWLTPAMDGLFAGPASERRRFLDRLVLTVNPEHARRAREFDRLLTQRNRLLEENRSAAWLDALEAQLAEHAVALALARAETVGLLSGRIAVRAEASAFPAGRIVLSGDFDRAVAGETAAEAEASYREALGESRSADRAAGRTLYGPHRSDLEVVFAEKAMPAAQSSTGEQKALLIGLILAHAELIGEVSGMTPLLLLDEIAAHLDPVRRGSLFDRLAGLGCQAFMTGTDAALFADLPSSAARYAVADDQVRLLN